MITHRPGHERGHANHGWLDTYHTFSFAHYYDPRYMGFGALRVINEDRIAPGRGFGTHPHRDMEILTYVIDGELEHRDSMGNGSIIHAGDVQRMSAGTGITHSEFNPSSSQPVHLLQIWIVPRTNGIQPSYEQHTYTTDEKRGQWLLIASLSGEEGSARIHQDASLYTSVLGSGNRLDYSLAPGRQAWVQIVHGTITMSGLKLEAGDGAGICNESLLEFSAENSSEILLFDLA